MCANRLYRSDIRYGIRRDDAFNPMKRLSEQELQQFIDAMKAERIKNTSTPEQAEQFLKELGFLDENGDLSEKYVS